MSTSNQPDDESIQSTDQQPTEKPKKPRKKYQKPDNEAGRTDNGEGSFYFSEDDGYWHARVVVGVKDDGTPDRRHRRSRDEKEAREKFRELMKMRDSGNVPKPGMAPLASAGAFTSPGHTSTSPGGTRGHCRCGLGEHKGHYRFWPRGTRG